MDAILVLTARGTGSVIEIDEYTKRGEAINRNDGDDPPMRDEQGRFLSSGQSIGSVILTVARGSAARREVDANGRHRLETGGRE